MVNTIFKKKYAVSSDSPQASPCGTRFRLISSLNISAAGVVREVSGTLSVRDLCS